jgi:hypothetical protein
MRGAAVLELAAAFALVAGVSSLAPSQRAEGGGCFLPLIMGDMTGSRLVSSGDALWVLRNNAGLLLPNAGHACFPEDVDCDGLRNAVDSLKILRFVVGLSAPQTEPCVDIGSEIPKWSGRFSTERGSHVLLDRGVLVAFAA